MTPSSSGSVSGAVSAEGTDYSATLDFGVAGLARGAAGAGQRTGSAETPTARSASQPERATPASGQSGSVGDFLLGLLDRLAQARTGGGSSGTAASSGGAATKSTPEPTSARPATEAVSDTVSDTVTTALTQARTEARAAANQASTSISTAMSDLPRGHVSCGLACQGSPSQGSPSRPTAPGKRQVDQLMGGAVDLASDIVSAVAGKSAGDRTRRGLSQVADEVSEALGQASKLNQNSGAAGTGNAPATPSRSGMTERATKQAHQTNTGPGLTGDRDSTRPECTSGPECADDSHALAGRKPATQAARGPPAGRAHHQARHQNQNSEQGSASPALARASQTKLDNTQLKKIFGRAQEFTHDLIGELGKLAKHAGRQDHATGNGGESTGHTGSARPNGSHGLASKISELVDSYVTDLLKLVGANGGSGKGTGGGSHQSGGSHRGGDSADLGEQISGLVDKFVSNVLKLVGKNGGGQGHQPDR
ncbi:hypothetical protein, partial [Pseudonocardia acaciae]|uniref:hypothetical protein n=1 Tax=Pseudonocardia acaciae TaxID=551276 RepID=UPI00048B79AD